MLKETCSFEGSQEFNLNLNDIERVAFKRCGPQESEWILSGH